MQETFQRELVTERTAEVLLEGLTDIHQVASWVPILTDLHEVEPLRRYTGVLEDRVGPFRLRADLDIDVTVDDRRIELSCTGVDRQIGSRISVAGSLDVTEVDGSRRIVLDGTYEVSGKAAQFGASAIRRKAEVVITAFLDGLERDLLAH